jgi:hypothetical protein
MAHLNGWQRLWVVLSVLNMRLALRFIITGLPVTFGRMNKNPGFREARRV